MPLISKKLHQVDLGDGEWVKIPSAYSYFDSMELLRAQAGKSTDEQAGLNKMLTVIVKEWNMKDAEGKPAELNEENIAFLDYGTVNTILAELNKLLVPSKKKSASSTEPSKDTKAA